LLSGEKKAGKKRTIFITETIVLKRGGGEKNRIEKVRGDSAPEKSVPQGIGKNRTKKKGAVGGSQKKASVWGVRDVWSGG